jgi:hypothetical protein
VVVSILTTLRINNQYATVGNDSGMLPNTRPTDFTQATHDTTLGSPQGGSVDGRYQVVAPCDERRTAASSGNTPRGADQVRLLTGLCITPWFHKGQLSIHEVSLCLNLLSTASVCSQQ